MAAPQSQSPPPQHVSYHDSYLAADEIAVLRSPGCLFTDKFIALAFEYFEFEEFVTLAPDVAFLQPVGVQLISLLEASPADLAQMLSGMLLTQKSYIFLPLNDNDDAEEAGGTHWALLVYARSTASFHLFDSVAAGDIMRRAASRVMTALTQAMHLRVEKPLMIEPCLQQSNAVDCGPLAIFFARAICEGLVSRDAASPVFELYTAGAGAQTAASAARKTRAAMIELVDRLRGSRWFASTRFEIKDLTLLLLQLTDEQVAEARRIFNKFDDNGNGTISAAEFERAAANVQDLSTAPVSHLLRVADFNNDKEISFEEFLEAVTYSTTPTGESTAEFNGLVRLVSNYCVASSDLSAQAALEKYKFCPPPLFMIIISLIQIALFIYYRNKECSNATLECPLSFSSPLAFRPGCREEVYRFETYTLVHAGWGHITFNLIIQLLVGIPLEMVHGSWRVAVVYLVGGLAGSFSSSVVDPMTNVVGASGAVFALIGAHVANMIDNFNEMPLKWIRLALLLIFVVLELALSLYQRYGSKTVQHVSYAGHLGGFLMGCTLGTFVLRNIRVVWYEKYIRFTGLAIAVVGCIFAIFWNIFHNFGPHGCPS